jgi:uncharacterized membrane protein YvbJ
VQPAVERDAPLPQPATGDDGGGPLLCSACGAGNETTRHFCRKCGAPLGQASAPAVAVTSDDSSYPWAMVVSVACIVLGVILLVIVIAGW